MHAGGSATGRRLLRELSALVVANERVKVIEGARVCGLWHGDGRCHGVVCGLPASGRSPRRRAPPEGRTMAARAAMLSTGGAAALWARTTNPPGSIGQGLLLGHAAGAALADLEFVSSTRRR